MNIARREKIVLLGMMTRIPVGGAVWGTMHYLLGLRRLGYDPYYVECHGLNPSMLMDTPQDDACALAAAFVDGVMRRFDLQHNWCFHAPHDGRYFGMDETALRQLYRDAALIINFHGATIPLPEHYATGRLIYLETDPVDTEIELHQGKAETVAFLEPHRAFFTWGLNYGQPDCRVPLPSKTNPRFDFKPMPPVVVPQLWAEECRPEWCKRFTTIGNWKQESRPPVIFEGERYTWSKHFEFLKFIDLPQKTDQKFELGLSQFSPADRQMLQRKGWHVRNALEFSRDINQYRHYIHLSRGEFTVAKDQNIRLRSGWFSERSAQYLAAGRPVITQDTGFGSYLPTGRGLFAFSTMEEILAAVDAINGDFEGHCGAARELAREYMSYEVVLPRLLAEVGLGRPRTGAASPAAAAATTPANATAAPTPPPRPPKSQGVNLCGYLRTESGVGTATRRYLAAFEQAGVPVVPVDVSHLQINRSQDDSVKTTAGDHPHDINVVCADVELHYTILSHFGADNFRNRYNIGIWAWELPQFPARWQDRFAFYDEIWVASGFIANMLTPISPVPVIRIPPVLTIEHPGSRERGRARLGVSDDEVVYLFVFDVHSHVARKNPMAVISAFNSAFSSDEKARLIIKCVNGESNAPALAAMHAHAKGRRISIYNGYWPHAEVQDLMAACDVYVSLHRSEGTGLTITDAMALGKPVIATGWSGNMEFMTPFNSYPVGYELTQIQESSGPYQVGQTWAEPSEKHAARLMRRTFDDRQEAAARGAHGQRDIEASYSRDAIAELIEQRLDAIRLRRRYEDYRRESYDRYLEYQQLPERIAASVQAHVPPEATVLVVSKGDERLLSLGRRTAQHFPQTPDGAYAGYYPKDSAAATQDLQSAILRGARYLVLPRTSFWWMDHYGQFAEYLRQKHRQVARDDQSCLIYALQSTP